MNACMCSWLKHLPRAHSVVGQAEGRISSVGRIRYDAVPHNRDCCGAAALDDGHATCCQNTALLTAVFGGQVTARAR